MKKNSKKIMLFVTAGLFILTGTYNALVINSDSHISSSNLFIKRLDEVYGVVKEGRQIAGFSSWKKLEGATVAKHIPTAEVKAPAKVVVESAPELAPEAGVQEELSLTLVEVSHPSKWKDGLKAPQFNGALSTNQGVIEDLSVSLPGGIGLSASFAEMTGNVFEYELNGEIQSGLMYQVNQNAYMVTLTSGPLEGTRLRFSSETPEQEQLKVQETLADNNIEVGAFGSTEAPAEMVQNEETITAQALQAQSFNLDQAPAL